MNVASFVRPIAKQPVFVGGPAPDIVNMLTFLSQLALEEDGIVSLAVIAERHSGVMTMFTGDMDISRTLGAMEILKVELIDNELGGDLDEI